MRISSAIAPLKNQFYCSLLAFATFCFFAEDFGWISDPSFLLLSEQVRHVQLGQRPISLRGGMWWWSSKLRLANFRRSTEISVHKEGPSVRNDPTIGLDWGFVGKCLWNMVGEIRCLGALKAQEGRHQDWVSFAYPELSSLCGPTGTYRRVQWESRVTLASWSSAGL